MKTRACRANVMNAEIRDSMVGDRRKREKVKCRRDKLGYLGSAMTSDEIRGNEMESFREDSGRNGRNCEYICNPG